MNFLFAFIFAVAATAAFAASTGCSGGASEGAEVVSGAYYYRCTGGTLVPAGCIDDSSNKVPIGSTFNSKSVQKTCQNNGGTLTVKCTACITDDGKVVQPGATADGTNVYFTCVANGEGFDLRVAGCIIGGQKVAVDQKSTQGDQVVVCQRSSTKAASAVASGCAKNGQTYDIGTQFEDDTAFYHCKTAGSNSVAEPIGCMADDKKVYDLDLYKKGSQYYRCRVGDKSVSADLWGCALVKPDGTVEPKSIACTWDTGSDPVNYVNCCIKKGDQAVITPLYCLYTNSGGRIQVNEGCYRLFDGGKTAAGCQRQTDGSLKMNTWDATDVSNSLAAGLHQC